jgi:hypothetical protein
MFDGLILSEHFDIYAKRYIDTMLMAKALHGAEAPASLAALAVQYGVGQKGDEVIRADGMRLEDFSPDELSTYGDYCVNDVELTYAIYCSMIRNGFPVKEKSLIDLTLKMFVRPRLELNLPMLEAHLEIIKDKKAKLLSESGHTVEDLMSNPKLADVLREYGVEPPTKISARTGKVAYAFSKTDSEFNALLEHDDLRLRRPGRNASYLSPNEDRYQFPFAITPLTQDGGVGPTRSTSRTFLHVVRTQGR